MRSLLLVSIFFTFSNQAMAAQVVTDAFEPKWNDKSFLMLTKQEKQELPLMEQVGLYMKRGLEVCEFLRAPAGRFSKRKVQGIQTGHFKQNGEIVVLERQRNGSLRAILEPTAKEDGVEIFRSIQCVGIR